MCVGVSFSKKNCVWVYNFQGCLFPATPGPSLDLLSTVDTTLEINKPKGRVRGFSTHLKPSQKVKFHLSTLHSCISVIDNVKINGPDKSM